MREVLRLGVVLLVICAVAGAVLAFVNGITKDRIAAQATIRLEQALRDVVPEAVEFQDDTERLLEVKSEVSEEKPGFAIVDKMYRGYLAGEVVGLAFMCSPSGYGGPLETVVGVSSDGKVSGISVIKHSETPGLGANITNPEFQMRFVGIPKGTSVKVKKDGGRIDAITGATISSRAVASAVDEALRVFEVVSGKGALENEL
ncbi:MAG: RnfABCDGE type electron transport complex subunit G [Firmicutes bacterium]|nr:RnfABCDGE type electron transport complex subunit G [Bacillota bacterium]HXL04478.1 RnfABCDGE type electron transport complex subunit G [Bacillota bacterium]